MTNNTVNDRKRIGDDPPKNRIFFISLSIVIFAFSLFRIHIGMHSDEAHFVAVGDMISRGNSLFKEIWYYQQMSGVVSAPIIYLYGSINGSREGVLLFIRFFSLAIQLMVCIYFFNTFKNRFDIKRVAIATIILYVFVPDFQSLNYKQAIIWLLIITISSSYRYYASNRLKYAFFIGLAISVCVLEYPTSILLAPLYLYILVRISKTDKCKKLSAIIYILTCFLCAVSFFIFAFSKISFAEFVYFFPKVFKDDNLDTRFAYKLIRPFAKYIAMFLMYSIPILCVTYIDRLGEIVKKLRIPVASLIMLLAFVGQCFIERNGITWHCVTYPFTIAMLALPCVTTNKYYVGDNDLKNEDIKTIVRLVSYPVYMAVFVMALASNQGNVTSMYPSVIAACGMLMIIGSEEFESEYVKYERTAIEVILLVCALSMYIFPVWEQEACEDGFGARTLFSSRIRVENGCLKGIYISEEYYKKYYDLYETEIRYTTDDDITLIIDDYDISAYGYINLRGIPSTFSPQGGLGIEKASKITDYLKCNERLTPDKIILNMEYIGDSVDHYLESTPLGEYIVINGYGLIGQNNEYLVFEKGGKH